MWEYDAIMLVICAYFGARAVVKKVPEETIEKYKKNLLLNLIVGKYYKYGKKINDAISESVETGTLKSAFKFGWRILYLFMYFTIINAIWYLIKMIIYSVWGVFEPNFMEGFSFMLGVGVASFILWFKNFSKHNQEIKGKIAEKKIGESMKASLELGGKQWVIFSTIFMWAIGEIVYLLLSPAYRIELYVFLIALLIAPIVYIVCKLILGLVGKKSDRDN